MKKYVFVLLAVSLNVCAQEEPTPVPLQAPPVEAPRPIESQKNYFGVRLGFAASSVGAGGAYGFYYGRRLDDQLILGWSFRGTRGGKDGDGQGNSSIGQYYRNHTDYTSTSGELSATYFFREQGYKRWGFLVRAGAGVEWGTISGFFKRYDDDPATIHIGDGYRLQETGPTVESRFTRGIIRLEPAYQFLWAPRSGDTIGGHTLELAIGIMTSNSQPTVSYSRPDGANFDVETPKVVSTFDVSYIMVF